MVCILPYVEQASLFDQYVNLGGTDATGPEYRAAQCAGTQYATPLATCPSDVPSTPACSTAGVNCHKAQLRGQLWQHGAGHLVDTGDDYTFQANLNGVVFQGAPFGSRETFSSTTFTTG